MILVIIFTLWKLKQFILILQSAAVFFNWQLHGVLQAARIFFIIFFYKNIFLQVGVMLHFQVLNLDIFLIIFLTINLVL